MRQWSKLGNKKALVLHILPEGTRAFFRLPWYHPVCHQMLQRNSSSSPHCDEGGMTTLNGYAAAWEPPTCAYLPEDFLRPAAHKRVLRRFIHSDLSPTIGSLSETYLILCLLNAGQTSLYICYL